MKLHKNAKDISGGRFGRLIALYPHSRTPQNKILWMCRCDCGTELVVQTAYLNNGNTKSCGCTRMDRMREVNTTHGMTKSSEYRIWKNIVQRCNNPDNPSYDRYGAKGRLCLFDSFESFLADIGPRPSRKHQVDRIDNDRGYEPGNVRWVLPAMNSRNRVNTVWLTYCGMDRPLSEWAEIFGAQYQTLYVRLRNGWLPEEVLFGRY